MTQNNKPHLIVLVGPPGSGKSTLAKEYEGKGYIRINQDDQGKDGHIELFRKAFAENRNIVVDRMNFSKGQRANYINLCIGQYTTEIIALYQPYTVCLDRCVTRQGHPTIKNEETALKALRTFFTRFEPIEDSEADKLTRVYPTHKKLDAIWCDLDGTLCNIDHRLKYVKSEKKDWKTFFTEMNKDLINPWCEEVIRKFNNTHHIVYCSGRPSNFKELTTNWLLEHGLYFGYLFMRHVGDFRQDNIVKEILLDFEVLTRFSILFCLDDRSQVVKMLRKRKLIVFQVADGEF